MKKLGLNYAFRKNKFLGGANQASNNNNIMVPLDGESYLLQIDSTTTTTCTISWNPYLTNSDSVNVYVDGVLAGNTSNNTYVISSLSAGNTVRIKIIPVISSVEQAQSNEVLCTPLRATGSEEIQIVGLISNTSKSLAGNNKSIRWAYVNSKDELASFSSSRIMIKRYDTYDIEGVDAEFLASKDIEGNGGYEIISPTDTQQTLPSRYSFNWRMPVVLDAVYRVFVSAVNSNGTSKWYPGPIITEGENWNPGSNVSPLWSTSDLGTGVVTLIENGVRTIQPDWKTAIESITPANLVLEGDGLEIDGVIRIDSATDLIECRVSGERFKKIKVFGKTGPEVDSIRSSLVVTEAWTDEGSGRFSTPIPAEYTVAGFPSYKTNTVWVGDLPLRQIGIPSYSMDLDKNTIGTGSWNNTLYSMTTTTMEEQTFSVDFTNSKIWVRLPGDVDPSTFNVELGFGTGVLSGTYNAPGGLEEKDHWEISNLTLAHGNNSATFGEPRAVLTTGRDGWVLKNVAILGGDTKGLYHIGKDTLIDNVLIDGSQVSAMVLKNTDSSLDWEISNSHPEMKSLSQNLTISASNVGQYFPLGSLGNKKETCASKYHERRVAVKERISTTFASYDLKNISVGGWFLNHSSCNILEESIFENLPFGIRIEVGPTQWQGQSEWGVDCRNIIDYGFNSYFYINNSTTNDAKTLQSLLKATNASMIGSCTILNATACLFIGGEILLDSGDIQATIGTDYCSAFGNTLDVIDANWSNLHIQPSVTNISVDSNYHVDNFSGTFGYNYSTDKQTFIDEGYSLLAVEGVPAYIDELNNDYRISGGGSGAINYGSSTPPPG